jgi:hypothetical protein
VEVVGNVHGAVHIQMEETDEHYTADNVCPLTYSKINE